MTFNVEITNDAWMAMQRERDELRAALNEALAQNERFNARYRDSEAEVERLRAALEAALWWWHDHPPVPWVTQAREALGHHKE